MPQNGLSDPGPERVDVIDAVTAGQQGMDHRQTLLIRVGTQMTRHREVLAQQTGQPEPLPQRRCDQQPGLGHAVVVIGAHLDPVERARLRHQEGAPST